MLSVNTLISADLNIKNVFLILIFGIVEYKNKI